MDRNSFVPLRIQKALLDGGWELTYSVFDKHKVQLGDKGIGSQKWEKDGMEIHLHYVPKDHKIKNSEVELWWGDNDSETFAMRTIISVLKRRKLL